MGAHATLGLVLEVEQQGFAGGGHADRHPQFLVATAGGPQARHVECGRIGDAEQRAERGDP